MYHLYHPHPLCHLTIFPMPHHSHHSLHSHLHLLHHLTIAISREVTRTPKLRQRVNALPSWQKFLHAFAAESLPILNVNLSGEVITKLSTAICRASIGTGKLGTLCSPYIRRFDVLVQQHLAHTHAQAHASAVADMTALQRVLDVIRGVASTTGANAMNEVFAVIQPSFKGLITILNSSQNTSFSLATQVLRVLYDYADSSIVFMNTEQARLFFSVCLEAVRAYGNVHQQRLKAFEQGNVASESGIDHPHYHPHLHLHPHPHPHYRCR